MKRTYVLIASSMLMIAALLSWMGCKPRRSDLSANDGGKNLCDMQIFKKYAQMSRDDQPASAFGFDEEAAFYSSCYQSFVTILLSEVTPIPEEALNAIYEALNRDRSSSFTSFDTRLNGATIYLLGSMAKNQSGLDAGAAAKAERLFRITDAEKEIFTRSDIQANICYTYQTCALAIERVLELSKLGAAFSSLNQDASPIFMRLVHDLIADVKNLRKEAMPIEQIYCTTGACNYDPSYLVADTYELLLKSAEYRFQFYNSVRLEEGRLPKLFAIPRYPINNLVSGLDSVIRSFERTVIAEFKPTNLHPQMAWLIDVVIGNEMIVNPTSHQFQLDKKRLALPSPAESLLAQNAVAKRILLTHWENVAIRAYLARVMDLTKGQIDPTPWLNKLKQDAQSFSSNAFEAQIGVKQASDDQSVVTPESQFRFNKTPPSTASYAGYFSPFLAWFTLDYFKDTELLLAWREDWALATSYLSPLAIQAASQNTLSMDEISEPVIRAKTTQAVKGAQEVRGKLTESFGGQIDTDLVRYEKEFFKRYTDFESLLLISRELQERRLQTMENIVEMQKSEYLAKTRDAHRTPGRLQEELMPAAERSRYIQADSVGPNVMMMCLQAVAQTNVHQFYEKNQKNFLEFGLDSKDGSCPLPIEYIFKNSFSNKELAKYSPPQKFSYLCGFDQTDKTLLGIKKRLATLQTGLEKDRICLEKYSEMKDRLQKELPYMILMPVSMGYGGKLADFALNGVKRFLFGGMAFSAAVEKSTRYAVVFGIAHNFFSAVVFDVVFGAVLQPLGLGHIYDQEKLLRENIWDIGKRVGLSTLNFMGMGMIGWGSNAITLQLALKPAHVLNTKVLSHFALESSYFWVSGEVIKAIDVHLLGGEELPELEGETWYTKLAHSAATAAIFRKHALNSKNVHRFMEKDVIPLKKKVRILQRYKAMNTPAKAAAEFKPVAVFDEATADIMLEPREGAVEQAKYYQFNPYAMLGIPLGLFKEKMGSNEFKRAMARQIAKWEAYAKDGNEFQRGISEVMIAKIRAAGEFMSKPENKKKYHDAMRLYGENLMSERLSKVLLQRRASVQDDGGVAAEIEVTKALAP